MFAATAHAPVREVAAALIRMDGETQSRASLCRETVDAYAQLMAEGAVFPPVRVWFDGENYWLADGFHRVEASKCAGISAIRAVVFRGTLEDARWDSLGANTTHGLRPSASDIELIVSRALGHRHATGMSVNQLAKYLGIPEPTLRRWIKKVSSSSDEARNASLSRITVDPTDSERDSGHFVRGLRNKHRLLLDLDKMREQVRHPDARAVLNALEKWFIGVSGAVETVAVIERVVSRSESRS